MFADAVPLLQDYLISSAERLPDKVALVCGDERVTYAELHRRSDELAAFLAARGVERGDRVLIFADNTVETVISIWATLKANAVFSVINPLTKETKLRYLLGDSRPAALVCDGHLKHVFVPAASDCAHLKCCIVAHDVSDETLAAVPGGVRFADARVEGEQVPRRAIDVDLASIIYTSGSTGEPKGVMLPHRGMRTAARSVSSLIGMREDDVLLSGLPLAFNYGLYQLIMTFKVGGRLVLEKAFAYPAKVLQRMAEEKVTGFPGVPTMFAMLGSHRQRSKGSPPVIESMRFITNTAAALLPKHVEVLRALFPKADIFSMYGLTECKRCTWLPPAELDAKPTSVGIPIPNTEMWLVDEEDRKLGPGEVGQLVIRGGTVMVGYWDKPELTEKALRPGPLPGERVFYTGDLCRLDDDGYLYFIGRMDDIIKSRGEKVPPAEVESALMNVEGVKEAAVIGVPDELLGEAIKAFVVLEDGVKMAERQLQLILRRNVESFMVPAQVAFVGELPKTSTGKIRRKSLESAG